MLTAEQQILGSLAIRGEPDAARLGELLPRARAQALVDLAEAEGVDGLLYANLRRVNVSDDFPADQWNRLQGRYRRTAALNLTRQRDLAELLEAGEQTGVSPLVLKGMALLDSLYPDIGLRPMFDIDLWVDPRQLEALTRTLESLGYRSAPYYPDTYRRASTSIDIHTHLLGAERIQSRTSILAKGQEPFFEHQRALLISGASASQLGRVEEVMYLILHLLKHNAERLLWLLEIDALLEGWSEADWSALRSLALDSGQEKSLIQVGFLADLLLEDRAAPGIARLAAPTRLGRLERRALARRASKGSLPIWAPLLFFSSQRGIGARFASIFESLFPRPEILRQIFEDSETRIWRLYFRRFGQLVERVLR